MPNGNGSPSDTAARLLTIADAAFQAANLSALAEKALPPVAALVEAAGALLFLRDADPPCYHHALPTEAADPIKMTCARALDRLAAETGRPHPASFTFGENQTLYMTLHPLGDHAPVTGLLGLAWEKPPGDGPTSPPEPLVRLLPWIAGACQRLIEADRLAREIAHLNAYQTVSSLLAQPLGLDEMMEATLYCCMEVVQAEAASILLLDESRENFTFFQVEGPAKPILMAATMPADQGLAGAVLQNETPEIINDPRSDSRFYQAFDDQSSFVTRNMIAVPLVAGGEKVGVLEVLNKVDGTDFTQHEMLTMMMFAEEVAFAIRNARVFEYVVRSYCKQRQGLHTCRGCERPLGAWTPCVKYRTTGTWQIVAP